MGSFSGGGDSSSRTMADGGGGDTAASRGWEDRSIRPFRLPPTALPRHPPGERRTPRADTRRADGRSSRLERALHFPMDRRAHARELMLGFASRGRRYLWTDAYAVCNWLGLGERERAL